nr:hypothetical protein Iba_chr09aCG16230 [Ipomoea batatas]
MENLLPEHTELSTNCVSRMQLFSETWPLDQPLANNLDLKQKPDCMLHRASNPQPCSSVPQRSVDEPEHITPEQSWCHIFVIPRAAELPNLESLGRLSGVLSELVGVVDGQRRPIPGNGGGSLTADDGGGSWRRCHYEQANANRDKNVYLS